MFWFFHKNSAGIIVHSKFVLAFAQNYCSNQSSCKAIYNVEPETLKKYFVEIDCFCYKKQTLLPGEISTYSITFYIDPIMINDSRFRNLNSMAISYTFLDSNNG